MKTTITLSDTFTVTSRGVSVTVDVTKLPAEMLAQFIEHGIRQKVSDAAASALRVALPDDMADADTATAKAWAEENPDAVATATTDLMTKAVASIESGEWSTRVAGGTSDPLVPFMRDIVRAAMKQSTNAKMKAEHDAMKTADGKADSKARAAFIDSIVEAKREQLEPLATAAKERADAEAKEKAKLAKSIDF